MSVSAKLNYQAELLDWMARPQGCTQSTLIQVIQLATDGDSMC